MGSPQTRSETLRLVVGGHRVRGLRAPVWQRKEGGLTLYYRSGAHGVTLDVRVVSVAFTQGKVFPR